MKQLSGIKKLAICVVITGALVAAVSVETIVLARVTANDDEKTPEMGLVNWSSDLGTARTKSSQTGKPIFLLFQEIPG